MKNNIDNENRNSVTYYRKLGMEECLKILQKSKKSIWNTCDNWCTWTIQCEPFEKVIDIIQIPAFLYRQTDFIEAAIKTNKIIHNKKGQFLNAQSMIKVVEKFRAFGHTNKIILCERCSMFSNNDLVIYSIN